jgi:hypothetical protein
MTSHRMHALALGGPSGQAEDAMDNRLPALAEMPPKTANTWDPGELITETQAYEEYAAVLEDKELRQARQTGRLGFLRRKRTIFYRRDELAEFVREMLQHGYVGPSKGVVGSAAGNPSALGRTTKPARKTYQPRFPPGSALERIAARRREGL